MLPLVERRLEAQKVAELLNDGHAAQIYQSLFQCCPDAVFLMSEVVVACSDKTCELWGCSREEIIGRRPIDFSPPWQSDGQSSEHALRVKEQCALAGTPQQFFWQFRRKDGSLVDAEVVLRAVNIDGASLVLASARELTQRKDIEAELRRAHHGLAIRGAIAHALLTIPEPAVYQQVLQVIMEAMHSAYALLGYLDRSEQLVTYHLDAGSWVRGKDPSLIPAAEWHSLWGRALRENSSLVVNDRLENSLGIQGLERGIAIPLQCRDVVVGVLMVASRPDDYTQDDIQLLRSVGAELAPLLAMRLERERVTVRWQQAEASLREALQVAVASAESATSRRRTRKPTPTIVDEVRQELGLAASIPHETHGYLTLMRASVRQSSTKEEDEIGRDPIS